MRFIICLLFIGISYNSQSQHNLSELLERYNNHDVPYMSVQELAMPKTNAVIFDARETEEHQISHIKNAILVGYSNFDINHSMRHLKSKDQKIVVYCSLGIRSEKIARELQKAGYTNVHNLYGGIFEWKNSEFVIVDAEGKPTENVHAFSRNWGKWLLKGNKVYGLTLD